MNSRIILVGIALLLSLGCQRKASEKQKETPDYNRAAHTISVIDAWARPASNGTNSAAYLRIYNGTDTTDTLLTVDTDVAGKAEVHESFQENGLSGMRPAGKQVIKPDSVVTLQPGGFHIMIMKLNRDIAQGDSISLQLHFAVAGNRSVMVPVQISN